jgi:hypothetical protein
VSATYSVCLLAISVPLGIWIVVSRPGTVGHAWTTAGAALGLVGFVAMAFVRWGLMVALAPRRA